MSLLAIASAIEAQAAVSEFVCRVPEQWSEHDMLPYYDISITSAVSSCTLCISTTQTLTTQRAWEGNNTHGVGKRLAFKMLIDKAAGNGDSMKSDCQLNL